MSVIGSNILAGASGGAGAAGYEIGRSLRFDSSASSYLSRTPSSAGNRKTWTWSGWVKRSKTGNQRLFTAGADGNNNSMFQFVGTDNSQFEVWNYQQGTGDGESRTRTNALFRDFSAWYHIVVSCTTTSLKIYVNGVELNSFAHDTQPNNINWSFNSTSAHALGRSAWGSEYFDGYLADVHFIDGQALAASDFGEFDANGVWQPKQVSGVTYGTNGFHLDFSDATSTTTIAEDSSGNNNDFTANNISVTAGSGNDSLFDSPTNGTQSDTGAGGEVSGNYCTLNPLHHLHAAALANGNLQTTSSEKAFSTFLLKTGKWYVEHKIDSTGYNLCFSQIDHPSGATPSSTDSKSIGWYIPNGYVYWGGTNSSANLGGTTMTGLDSSGYMSNAAVGDIIAAAIDMDNSTIKFYKNGSEVGSIDFSTGTAHRFTEGMYVSQFDGYGHWNFGQRAFAYTAPSGYKALCTTNLPTPTIADGSDYFDIALDTGANILSSTKALCGGNANFLWIKDRDNDSTNHHLIDIVRDPQLDGTPYLISNDTDDEATLGTYSAPSGNSVGWAWDAGSSTVSNTDGSITSQVRANPSAGFSIVSYTGDGAASATIGHGLNAVPEFIIVKNRDVGDHGAVYHVGTDVTNPQNYFLKLFAASSDGAAARSDVGAMWNDTVPTSSVFSVGTEDNVNASSEDYIAYCFAPVAGYSAFGSYEGNGSTDGLFVFTGMRPRWVLTKASSSTGLWNIHDTARSNSNPTSRLLWADSGSNEIDYAGGDFTIDCLSNGFKARAATSSLNSSGVTYIYVALAENPFQANGGLAR